MSHEFEPEDTVRAAYGTTLRWRASSPHQAPWLYRQASRAVCGGMNYYFLLIPPLALAGFVGFWCLIVKMLALAGWQRLATHYRVDRLPAGPLFRLGQASVGGIRYRGAMRAGASAEGLALATGFPFGVGHPPLLIPWSAFGPVRGKTSFWMTSYETSIQTPTSSVALSFASQDLIEAVKPWLRVAVVE